MKAMLIEKTVEKTNALIKVTPTIITNYIAIDDTILNEILNFFDFER